LVLLTAGLDWLHVTPEVNTSSERARADFELFQPVVGLSLAWQLSFARAFAGWLALGVERDLLGHHFDVQAEQERRTVLEPWPVLPVMSVGVRWWP
jgi:hypothetical protein